MTKKTKKRNDIDYQICDCFRLKSIRLLSYGASVMKAVKDGPLAVEISMSGTANQNKEKTGIAVEISFSVNFKDEPKSQNDVLANFSGKYQLVYSSDSPCDIEAKQLELYVKRISVNDAWPYWRELVQETSSRMGMILSPLPCSVNFTDASEEHPAEEQHSQEDNAE